MKSRSIAVKAPGRRTDKFRPTAREPITFKAAPVKGKERRGPRTQRLRTEQECYSCGQTIFKGWSAAWSTPRSRWRHARCPANP